MTLSNRKSPKGFQPSPDDARPSKLAAAGDRPTEPLDPAQVPSYGGRTKVGVKETVAADGGDRRKDPFERPRMRRASSAPLDLPPMRQADRVSEKETPAESYVRMRVLVEGDTLRVLDSHLVDGPLREGDTFPGRYAYDVTLGSELLHAGPAPDLGVRRSFIPPSADPEERTHHETELDTTIFTVRVPADRLTAARLADIQVTLYRLKEEASGNPAREPLPERFPRQTRVVAARSGLPRSVLPAEIRRRAARSVE